LLRLFSGLYAMIFGAGENWRVWAIVTVLLAGVYVVLLTNGFSEPVTLSEVVFLVGYVALSAIGVYVRRKRRRDA